jgi:hypothetical protein
LITLHAPAKDHLQHVQKAVAGGKTDPLLARNLASHFMGDQKPQAPNVVETSAAK